MERPFQECDVAKKPRKALAAAGSFAQVLRRVG